MFDSFNDLPDLEKSFNIILGVLLIIFLFGGIFLWKKNWKKVSTIFFLGFFCIIWGIFFETKRLVLRNIQLDIEGFPSLKIGIVSDFHLRPSKKDIWLKKIVNIINIQKLDFVLIPGDFLTGKSQEFSKFLYPLRDIKVPTFHVLGNHDYHFNGKMRSKEDLDFLRKNIQIAESIELKNSSFFLEKYGVMLIGVEDNYLGFHDLEKAYTGVSSEIPKILLAHSPDIFDEIPKNLYPDLIISGHTHCGQIRFPIIGALPYTIPTINGKKFEKGWYQNEKVFVTCGAGETGVPARFLNPPEVVVLKIN